MENKKRICVPKPCHEDWNKMSKTEKGRFCESCSFEVHDFTNSNEEEIIAVLAQAKGRVCGHFRAVDVDTTPLPERLPKQRITFWYGLQSFFLPLLGLLGLSSAAQAQNMAKVIGEYGPNRVTLKTPAPISQESKHIEGVVKEMTTNEPVAGANISILENGQTVAGTVADGKGHFTTIIPAGHLASNVVSIRSEAPGYATQTIEKVALTKEKVAVNIDMQHGLFLLGNAFSSVPIEDEGEPELAEIEWTQGKPVLQDPLLDSTVDGMATYIIDAETPAEEALETIENQTDFVRGNVIPVEPLEQVIHTTTGIPLDYSTLNIEIPTIEGLALHIPKETSNAVIVPEVITGTVQQMHEAPTTTPPTILYCSLPGTPVIDPPVASKDVQVHPHHEPVEETPEKEEALPAQKATEPKLFAAPTGDDAPFFEAAVFPNPARASTTVAVNVNTDYTVTVISTEGQVVLQENFKGDRHQLNLDSFSSGNYFVSILSKDQKLSKTLQLVVF